MAAKPPIYREFGKLLIEGIRRLARHRSMGVVHTDLAERLDYSSNMIYAWRSGTYLPKPEIIERLARMFVKEGQADRKWIKKFLEKGEYGSSEHIAALLADLFGEQVSPPQGEGTSSEPHVITVPISEDEPAPSKPTQTWQYNAESQDLSSHLEETLRYPSEVGKTIVPPDDKSKYLERQLPIPTYSHLFGVETYIEELLRYLQDRQDYRIISIQGMGGIGKTALADKVVRELIKHDSVIQDLLWISAKQEYLTEAGIFQSKTQMNLESLFDDLGQGFGLTDITRLPLAQKVGRLASLFRDEPYLIVIDNLETVQDFQGLIPWLEKLVDPTKFLLTSRWTVPSLTTVVPVSLTELDQGASLALIRHIAQEKKVRDFYIRDIYDLVGGNPLAIILMVSQMRYLPPTEVLKGMRLGTTEQIYSYIYWKSWSILSKEAQDILFRIQQAGDEADWNWLVTMTELSSQDLLTELQHLIDLSLVHPQRGPNDERCYTIHRLTSTFLRTEVLGWK